MQDFRICHPQKTYELFDLDRVWACLKCGKSAYLASKVCPIQLFGKLAVDKSRPSCFFQPVSQF